mgnify:CR=1 FL=1
MADITGKVKALIESVRGKLTTSDKTPSGRPLDQRRDGYRLYQREQQAMGEPAVPYEDWIKTQSP